MPRSGIGLSRNKRLLGDKHNSCGAHRSNLIVCILTVFGRVIRDVISKREGVHALSPNFVNGGVGTQILRLISETTPSAFDAPLWRGR